MSEFDETNPEPVAEATPSPEEVPAPSVEPTAPPIVVLDAVTARDMAAPRRRARGALASLSVSLGPGVFAFVGAPEDGTIAISEILTGARAPLRGRVLVAGEVPTRSKRVRARIGVLGSEPQLPAARTVRDAVTIAQQARGQALARPMEVLTPLGLDHLGLRDPNSLSFAENRAVELAIALSTPAPLLIALHEPLADVAINLLGVVRERIRMLAESGACVVITTSSPADARALGDRVFVLHRGAILSTSDAADPLPGSAPLLIAWVRPAEPNEGLAPVRVLARLLAERPEVSSVAWSDKHDSPPHAAELRLSGSDLDACALALADAATEAGAVIEAIAPASPGITRLRAAAETVEALRRATALPKPEGAR